MEKQKLLKQEKDAFQKYRQFEIEGNAILATYWYRKFKKYANMRKLAAALVKRQLKANGITKLNSIKI